MGSHTIVHNRWNRSQDGFNISPPKSDNYDLKHFVTNNKSTVNTPWAKPAHLAKTSKLFCF